jgi:hypothetical protein
LIRQHRISKFKIHYLGEEAASARPQFIKEGSFYEEEVRAGGATVAQEGLGIAKLGISTPQQGHHQALSHPGNE